ncbi:MAG: MFS transporter [bacterium]
MAQALALRRNVAMLLVMLILVGTGEKLFQRFLPLYLTKLGAGALVVGLYGFMENALGALYALPGGTLTDRLGHRTSLLLFAVLNLVGYAVLAIPFWPAVLVAITLSMAWSQLSLPATFSLVAEQLPKGKRVMGLAVQAIIRRVPMALGPVVGGMVFAAYGIVAGMPRVLLAAAALTLLAVFLQMRLARPEKIKAYEPLHPLQLWRTFRPELRRLLVSDILIRFCEQIPNAFVILWVVDRAKRTDLEFGWLTAIEMAAAASLYIPVALWADARARQAPGGENVVALATERKPFVIATFCFFTAFPVILYFAAGWRGLVAAFIVRGLKEFGEPSRKATIVDLAAEGVKARTVGLYYMIRDVTVAFAALGGGWLWAINPALNLWTAFAFGIAGTLIYAMSSARTPP